MEKRNGGTGMLAPFCQSIDANNLIMGARFKSNSDTLHSLSKDVIKIPLDYIDKESQKYFLQQLTHAKQLKYCILWGHSPAHSFSCKVIEVVSNLPIPPTVIHVFGSQADDSQLSKCAQEHTVKFIPVKLGRVETTNKYTHKQQIYDSN